MTTYVLAGFVSAPRWVPPETFGAAGILPAEVATVSECLVDLVPSDQDRFETAGEAHGHEGHTLSMSVPADEADALRELMAGWGLDPLAINLGRGAAPPGGSELGLEAQRVTGLISEGGAHPRR